MNDVKPETRRERAARTRFRIAKAAGDLFAEEGYAGTTIEAVAHRAGVAVQTVYFVFHTKPQLLVESVQIAGGGSEGGSEVMARAWIQEVIAAPDGARRLALAIEHGSLIYQRLAPLWPAILAALAEPEVREAWERIVRGRREGMRRIVDLMASRHELRSGLDPSIASDILFGLHRHELYLAFTHEAGWTFDRYRAWTYATLCDQLLPPDVARSAVLQGSPATAGLALAQALPELGH
jgi:TetR/AcrR family transcriptional regulator of autoinduction and epiphytic fitness